MGIVTPSSIGVVKRLSPSVSNRILDGMLREVVLSRAQLSILGIKTYGLSTNKCESVISTDTTPKLCSLCQLNPSAQTLH